MKKMLDSGKILEVFGSKNMLTVTEAYDIDKLRFSIIQIGSGGKDHLDFYMNLSDFRIFVAKFDSKVVKKEIESAKGSKTQPYSWTTGENGNKHFTLSQGDKGILATISIDGERKSVVLKYEDLYELVFMYKLTTGLITVMKNTYYGDLLEAFKNRKMYEPKN